MISSSAWNWIMPLLIAVAIAVIGWQMTRSLRRLNAARDAGAFATASSEAPVLPGHNASSGDATAEKVDPASEHKG